MPCSTAAPNSSARSPLNHNGNHPHITIGQRLLDLQPHIVVWIAQPPLSVGVGRIEPTLAHDHKHDLATRQGAAYNFCKAQAEVDRIDIYEHSLIAKPLDKGGFNRWFRHPTPGLTWDPREGSHRPWGTFAALVLEFLVLEFIGRMRLRRWIAVASVVAAGVSKCTVVHGFDASMHNLLNSFLFAPRVPGLRTCTPSWPAASGKVRVQSRPAGPRSTVER
jgi:hypothetical protein